MATGIKIAVSVLIARVFFHIAAICAEFVRASRIPGPKFRAFGFGLVHVQGAFASSVTNRAGLTRPITVSAMSTIYATSVGGNPKEESSQACYYEHAHHNPPNIHTLHAYCTSFSLTIREGIWLPSPILVSACEYIGLAHSCELRAILQINMNLYHDANNISRGCYPQFVNNNIPMGH